MPLSFHSQPRDTWTPVATPHVLSKEGATRSDAYDLVEQQQLFHADFLADFTHFMHVRAAPGPVGLPVGPHSEPASGQPAVCIDETR
jgi:hypothetical protein